ncbi:MAG: hypothetical protein V2A62_03300 [Candidatus Woesearchaeota archaeon]
MAEDDLVGKVQDYLARFKNDHSLPCYPLESQGLYQIIGGVISEKGGREPLKEIVRGRFIDALAYAVQQPQFYAKFRPDDPCNNGYVKRVKVCEPKYKGLLKKVKLPTIGELER